MTKKAKSETQLYRLYQLLGDAGEKGIPKAVIVSKLGVKDSSVPVYIHSLKKKFGAKIENVTEGRIVTGYVLLNGGDLEVPQFKRAVNSATKKAKNPSPVDGSVPVLDADVETLHSDSEVRDTLSGLGIGDPEGFRGSDY